MVGTAKILASFRRSVTWGAARKTARAKIKKARREKAKERLWANSEQKVVPGIPERSWHTL